MRVLLRRLFGLTLDQTKVEEGRTAAKTGEIDNPYPKGSIEHRSWKRGYRQADDWDYVW